ncbi:ATP synthase F1 beta chain, putative [Babesia caballi]|uniref:H(+)-transporting two-sector ATPase n=1 Tax=Babesia caballi TaxID=5871 RepID=A0AAV4M231_BABCB|nr:ATP synthase F1 beta chain, putative [Babesia caballi]
MLASWSLRRALLSVCVLVSLYWSSVTAGDTASPAGVGCTVPEPASLKDAFRFFGALSEHATLRDMVIEKLVLKSKLHYKKEGIAGGKYDIKTCMNELLAYMKTVQTYIANKSLSDNGNYCEHGVSTGDHSCVERHVEILLHMLPRLYNSLLYIYFQTDTAFNGREGGTWATYRCNDTDVGLGEWLISSSSEAYFTSTANSNVPLLPGGFNKNELSSNEGSTVGGELSQLLDPEEGGSSLPNLLLLLCLNMRFTRASTALSLIAVKAFCTAVTGNAFGDETKKFTDLQVICSELSNSLEPLTSNEKTDKYPLFSLFIGNDNEYEKLLLSNDYKKYVEWLNEILPKLIENLDGMRTECSKWFPSTPYKVSQAGPFSYGFAYGKIWADKTSGTYPNMSILSNQISKLTTGEASSKGSLQALRSCLNPASAGISSGLPSQTDSPGAGSVTSDGNQMRASGNIHSGSFQNGASTAEVDGKKPDVAVKATTSPGSNNSNLPVKERGEQGEVRSDDKNKENKPASGQDVNTMPLNEKEKNLGLNGTANSVKENFNEAHTRNNRNWVANGNSAEVVVKTETSQVSEDDIRVTPSDEAHVGVGSSSKLSSEANSHVKASETASPDRDGNRTVHTQAAETPSRATESSTNVTGVADSQEGVSDVKKSPFFTGGIIAIVVVVALVALGRIINVNGDALNGYSRIHDTNSPSTHREAVSFSDHRTDEALLITGIKVVDMLAFYARGGKPGRFVELQDTISGVKEILDGECDDMPEMAFYMVGGLQEAKEKAAEMSKTK